MHMGALVDVKKVLCFNVESNLNPKKKKKKQGLHRATGALHPYENHVWSYGCRGGPNCFLHCQELGPFTSCCYSRCSAGSFR